MREGGYAQIFFPEGNKESVANLGGQRVIVSGNMYEASTLTCAHCGRVEHIPHKPDVNAVGFCRHCMKAICRGCSGKPCEPFERSLEEVERKAEILRNYNEHLR